MLEDPASILSRLEKGPRAISITLTCRCRRRSGRRQRGGSTATDPRLNDHRPERLVDPAARLEQGREERSLPQLRDGQLDRAGRGVQLLGTGSRYDTCPAPGCALRDPHRAGRVPQPRPGPASRPAQPTHRVAVLEKLGPMTHHEPPTRTGTRQGHQDSDHAAGATHHLRKLRTFWS